MGVADRVRERAVNFLEESTGLTITDKEELGTLREHTDQFRQFREEAEDLAHWTMAYFSGRPSDMRPEKRRSLAQKARIAWGRDPIAGTEAEHYAHFSIGRGVNRPRAENPKVQSIINRGWKDANNEEKLTSTAALYAISNELRATSNVYPLAFVGGGRVRISFLEADAVEAIVTDEPEDRLRPLYYVAQTQNAHWDKDKHMRIVDPQPKTQYFKHWRNVEEAKQEKEDGLRDSAPFDPGPALLGKGVVYHVRVNRLLEQQFGMPFWNRTLRFFSALNRLMEARVSMAQASASIIAKTVMSGGEKEIMRAAEGLQRRTGEFGAAHTRDGFHSPVGPGAIRHENAQDRLEAVNLNSGSSGAMQDINIIRGAATAPSAMGQHYFGDTSGGLSQAATLELPAMMAMGAWQETIEGLLRWFTDLLIQEAVRSGELGAGITDDEDSTLKLGEFRITESEDVEEIEKRLGIDLSYSFEMPYPGRRNLTDVTTTFTQVLTQLSPIGENPELTETMLNFLFTHGMQLEDAAELAASVNKTQQGLLKRQAEDQAQAADQKAEMERAAADQAAQQAQAKGDPPDGGNRGAGGPEMGSTRKRSDDTKRSQYGEPRKASEQKSTGVYKATESEDPEVAKLLEEIEAIFTEAADRVDA